MSPGAGGERRAPALDSSSNLHQWGFTLCSCFELHICPDLPSLQRLAGYHLLLQLQYFDCAGHAGSHPHVHCCGISVLHRLHQGGVLNVSTTLCWFGGPSRSSSLSLCRSIIFTVAAAPACPRLRRNGPQEPGRTLMSRLQLSRRPWVQPQEACRISSRVHSTRTTRCSLFNKEMMRQICQTLGKIPRKRQLAHQKQCLLHIFGFHTWPKHFFVSRDAKSFWVFYIICVYRM